MLRSKSRLLILIFFLLSGCITPRILAQNVWFNKFKGNNDLAESFIYTLQQDNKGYLWIGTGDGLFKFDGKDATKYTVEDSLSEDFVTASARDEKGNIWFGHFQGGITLYNGKSFKKIRSTAPLSRINAIYRDEANKICWLVTQSSGILKIDDNLKIKVYPFPVADKLCYSITAIDPATFLVGTNEGLYKIGIEKNDKLVFKEFIKQIPADVVKNITPSQSANGKYWITTEDNGLYSYTVNGITENYNTGKGLLSNNVQSVCERDNEVFIATSLGVTILKRSDKGFTVKNIGQYENAEDSYITYSFKDRESNIWFGTYGKGLIQLLDQRFVVYTKSNGLTGNHVFSIIKDKKSNYWLGTDNGISKMDSNFQFKKYYPIAKNDDITSLCEDGNGNIWAGTYANGLFIINPLTDNIHKLAAINEGTIGSIPHIIKDRRNHLWVATISNGLFEYDQKEQLIIRYTTSNGMVYNDITSLFEDSKGRIWFASKTNSFGYIVNNKVNLFNTLNTESKIEINCLAEDKMHNIWIGTDGNGLYKYDGKKFSEFSKNSELLSPYCYSLQFFRNNELFISHKNGISKYNLAENKVSTYTEEDGLLSLKNNDNVILNDNDDNLWFGTQDGVVKYDAQQDKTNAITPIVTIVGLQINNEYKNAEIPVKLATGAYSIKFFFNAVCLKNTGKVRYKYKLEGYDNDWSEPMASTTALYSRLTHGDYTLLVMACNSEGVWSNSAAQYSFSIKAPIWQSTWFYIIAVIVLILAIILYTRLKTRYMRSQNKFLETRIKQRTMELEIKNKDIYIKSQHLEKANALLGKQNKEIDLQKEEYKKLAGRLQKTNEQLDSFAHTVAHDLKAPLKGIGSLLNWIIENKETSSAEETTEYLVLMAERLDMMDKLIVGILDYSKSIRESNEDFAMVESREIVNNVITMLNADKNYTIETGVFMPPVFTQGVKLQQVFKNLIGNAIKYHDKEKGLITVNCAPLNDFYQFTVTDDGPGIEKEYHQKVFDIFQTVEGSQKVDSTGIGLSIVRKIIEDFGGKIWVESEVGKGASFVFTIPKR